MRILVAYDGSRSSDNALDDLQKAGLPDRDVEAVVMSVAEVWMPPPPSPNGDGYNKDDYPDFINEIAEKRLKVAESSLEEAKTLSRHAKERIVSNFPDWNVTAEAAHGSPAWEILGRADEFNPNLIVLGSHGQSAVSRILIGSISQKVLTEAKCSVRVARGKVEVDPAPSNILIGFDGSQGSMLAIEQVASRKWREGSKALLIAATHSLVPTAIGRFTPPIRDWVKEDDASEKEWIARIAEGSIKKLEDAGVNVELEIRDGNPKQVIVDRATDFRADCIFIGAHSYTLLERILIGSTSLAVAARAACSVEVVRSDDHY